MKNNEKVMCFGETLWDVFPGEKKPGGAPMNVAVHLRRFGYEPRLISRIGKDQLGSDLVDFLQEQGLDTQFVQQDDKYSTGVVNVQIGESGDAHYDIVYPSAWDFIDFPAEVIETTDDKKILVFGSLASRNEHSQNTLFKLLPDVDLALFDVNFREPHYSRNLIELLLFKSNIVKLNEHELKIVGAWMGMGQEDQEAICAQMAQHYDLHHIILTLGGDGAYVLKDGKGHRQGGFSVDVVDTVGSGDSFLAAYLAEFLQGSSIDRCLEMACATGAYVASNKGAVPDYEIQNIQSLIENR